jgi:uncharacterized protein
MSLPATAIDRLDWRDIARRLDIEGYAMLPGLMASERAQELARLAIASEVTPRGTLAAEELGRGELLYFGAALPAPWAGWRSAFYRHLAGVANRWNEVLAIEYRYPAKLDDFLRRNRQAGQVRPQSYLNRLGVEDYLALHQRGGEELVFPLQVVVLLSEPGRDFQGGEFVMTEQRPRMQSRPMVLPLRRGDAAIISTTERPFRGSRGYYRVNLKHAISRVSSGERLGLELSFHDALMKQP